MKLILVGGFLGAGKTTLLATVARRLKDGGHRVGLITNDQAPELVDTSLLSKEEAEVAEVSGSCFCCNFPGMMAAIEKLRSQADVIVAEPVGSCTDLSATLVQPIKDFHANEVSVAPLSVLADPARLSNVLDGGHGQLHPSAAYIFRKQLEEADTILISKADLLSPDDRNSLRERTARAYPLAKVRLVSAQTGEGIDEWLAETLEAMDAGRQIVDVDYDVYAEGEAVLGWLNATFRLKASNLDGKGYVSQLLHALANRFDAEKISVGHVKAMVQAGEAFVVGNLTGTAETLSVRGDMPPGDEARLTLNARVETSPDHLDAMVRETLSQFDIESMILEWRCFSPGRPEPTHRYDRLVSVIQTQS